MVNINIIYDNIDNLNSINFDIFNFLKGSSDFLLINNTSKNNIRITLVEQDINTVIMKFLGKKTTFPLYQLQSNIDNAITQIFSYKRTEICNMKVKGRDGKKFMPSIFFYSKRNDFLFLPDKLEFLRGSYTVQKKHSWCVKTDSPILLSILSSSRSLYFLDTNKVTYELEYLNGEISLYAQETMHIPICDFFTQRREINAIRDLVDEIEIGDKNCTPVQKLDAIIIYFENESFINAKKMSLIAKLVSKAPRMEFEISKKLEIIKKNIIQRQFFVNTKRENENSIKQQIVPVDLSKNTVSDFLNRSN